MEQDITNVSLDKTNILGNRLRDIRVNGGFGTIEDFSKLLNVNKNTLGTYERADRLPDIEFLAIFSQVSNTDFISLLISRLKSSSLNEAKQLGKVVKKKCIIQSKNNEKLNNPENISSTSIAINNDVSEENNEESAFRGVRNILTEQYSGNNAEDKNVIIKMLLNELLCGNNINEYAFTEINNTLKKLNELDSNT